AACARETLSTHATATSVWAASPWTENDKGRRLPGTTAGERFMVPPPSVGTRRRDDRMRRRARGTEAAPPATPAAGCPAQAPVGHPPCTRAGVSWRPSPNVASTDPRFAAAARRPRAAVRQGPRDTSNDPFERGNHAQERRHRRRAPVRGRRRGT